jgi:hypothetical protein
MIIKIELLTIIGTELCIRSDDSIGCSLRLAILLLVLVYLNYEDVDDMSTFYCELASLKRFFLSINRFDSLLGVQ